MYVLILSLLKTDVTTKILVAVCGYTHICSSENFKEIRFDYQPGLVCSRVGLPEEDRGRRCYPTTNAAEQVFQHH
jgi:hypothetical protein